MAEPSQPPAPVFDPNAPNIIALFSLLLGVVPLTLALLAMLTAWLAPLNAEQIVVLWSDWTFPVALVAVVLGHLALRRARHYYPRQAWRGFAFCGLVLSYLALLGWIGYIVYFVSLI